MQNVAKYSSTLGDLFGSLEVLLCLNMSSRTILHDTQEYSLESRGADRVVLQMELLPVRLKPLNEMSNATALRSFPGSRNHELDLAA